MDELPLEKVKSLAPIVVYDEGTNELISEHESTPEAVQALARYSNLSYIQPSIFRRGRTVWMKY